MELQICNEPPSSFKKYQQAKHALASQMVTNFYSESESEFPSSQCDVEMTDSEQQS